MLVDGRHETSKSPSIEGSGADVEESEVVFFSFDGTFGTGAVCSMGVPQGGVSRDRGAQSGVGLWVGVYHASIGRW
jgi:hypothetical protein